MEITIQDGVELLKSPVRHKHAGKEKDFEQTVLLNIQQICEAIGLPEIERVKSQPRYDADGFRIRPDIIVEHVDGSATVFEVKKHPAVDARPDAYDQLAAVGQLLLYKTVLDGVYPKVRLALIDNKIFFRTFCAFLQNNLPITLLDFQKDELFMPYNGWMDEQEGKT